MKKKLKKTGVLLLILTMSVLQSVGTMAYFERGPVHVYVGEQDVALEAGQSKAVSLSFDPSESQQLPGCGMAECPQICGEKECLDENGECRCNGTVYQTWRAFAEVSSSNMGVATAIYEDGGILQIYANSVGTAVITVTASLRQFNSTSTEVYVTVTEPSAVQEEPQPGGNGTDTDMDPGSDGSDIGVQPVGNTPDPDRQSVKVDSQDGVNQPESDIEANEIVEYQENGTVHPGVTVLPRATVEGRAVSASEAVSDNTAKKKKKKAAAKKASVSKNAPEKDSEDQKEEAVTTIKSDRGEILMVPITSGKIGKKEMESILGKEMYVDFQMKDAAENVLYTWEFYGMELKEAQDLDMMIDIGTSPWEGCGYGTASDSMYLSFAHDGELPGKATIYVRVADAFTDGDVLDYHQYDPQNGVQLVAEGLTVENGYVTLPMEHCSDYILTTDKWEDVQGASSGGIHPAVIVIGVIAAAAAAGGCFIFWKKRRQKVMS